VRSSLVGVHGGLILELGHPTQGREEPAFELVNTFLASIERFLADGRLHAFRWYGLEDGDLGRRAAIIVLEGSADQLAAFSASEEYRELRYAAPSFLQGFQVSRARPPDPVETDGVSLLTSVLQRWHLVEG
jgi:hypothetical protein